MNQRPVEQRVCPQFFPKAGRSGIAESENFTSVSEINFAVLSEALACQRVFQNYIWPKPPHSTDRKVKRINASSGRDMDVAATDHGNSSVGP